MIHFYGKKKIEIEKASRMRTQYRKYSISGKLLLMCAVASKSLFFLTKNRCWEGGGVILQ